MASCLLGEPPWTLPVVENKWNDRGRLLLFSLSESASGRDGAGRVLAVDGDVVAAASAVAVGAGAVRGGGGGDGVVPDAVPGYGGSPWAAAASGDRGVELINLLRQCAFDVDAGSLERADACLARIAGLLSSSSASASSASPTGGGGGGGGGQATRFHRLATIFTDALARRLLRRPLPGAYEALLAPAASSDPLLVAAARRHFFDLCPFLKLAFLTSNQAILEQMEGERVVHIVDLAGPAADPAQWLALLRALRARPEGPAPPHHRRPRRPRRAPPHLRPPLQGGRRPRHVLPVPPRPLRLDALDFDSLRVKTGEALAVSSVLQLHSLLPPRRRRRLQQHRRPRPPPRAPPQPRLLRRAPRARALPRPRPRPRPPVQPQPRRALPRPTPPHSPRRIESFLSGLLALAPKIVVVTEQEANHNGAAFCERFSEALYYYAAMFDCLETTAPRSAAEWGRVERLLLGEQIRNIVACEGAERRSGTSACSGGRSGSATPASATSPSASTPCSRPASCCRPSAATVTKSTTGTAASSSAGTSAPSTPSPPGAATASPPDPPSLPIL
uniref:Uncharacterized protein n=1 Tax=Ananas comosus var. bracteatus TaxID=296719 RepID=A0A6V7PFE6_ANACO|nr:unnamed protein product [Ananas comosus var. bracteatus]